MYKIAKIVFKPLIDNEETIVEKIRSIIQILIQNGQILDESVLESHENYYIANVITTDDDSLDIKYNNRYLLREIGKFDIDIKII